MSAEKYMKLIAQGAEALIKQSKQGILKDRIVKSYRLPQLDNKLRKQRTRTEVRLLTKASQIIPAPNVLSSNDYQITLENIKGKKLSQYLDKLKNKKQIANLIGKSIAKLHDNNIIHGDLTTSNMIYANKKKNNKSNKLSNQIIDNNSPKVYMIDFGLGFSSARVEDKATDLHVLKEALEAKHHKFSDELWHAIIHSYKNNSIHSHLILKQLEKVETRGRYKQQY